MKAWLVTWEWMSDSAAVADYVAAILPPRMSDKHVCEIVEFMYARVTSNISELAQYAKSLKSNPYRAKREPSTHGTPTVVRYVCGSHPWLSARKISELKISRAQESGIESISWKEPDWYVFDPDAFGGPMFQPGREGRRRTHTRQVTGPLRDQNIWDRREGRWIDGFVNPDV